MIEQINKFKKTSASFCASAIYIFVKYHNRSGSLVEWSLVWFHVERGKLLKMNKLQNRIAWISYQFTSKWAHINFSVRTET